MADVWAKLHHFDSPTSTGTQYVTVSGMGTPKAAIFFHGWGTAFNSSLDNNQLGFGATDGSGNIAVHAIEADNYGTTDTARSYNRSYSILRDGSWNPYFAAAATSFITDGVRLDWDYVYDSARKILVLFLGGADLSADIIDFQPSGIGNTSHTGMDFAPDVLVTFGTGLPTAAHEDDNAILALGCATRETTTQNYCAFMSSVNGEAATKLSSLLESDRCTGQMHNEALSWSGAITAWAADGFTMTTYGSSTGSDRVGILALKIDGGEFHLGDYDTATSTGTQAYTSPGFEPLALLGVATNLASMDAIATDRGCINIFASDGTDDHCHIGDSDDGAATTVCWHETNDAQLLNIDGSDASKTDLVDATLDSFDASGFTLDYSTVDGTARKFWALAIGAGGGATTVTPSAVSATWSAVAPSTLISVTPSLVSPATATWSAVTPATSGAVTVTVSAVSATWTPVAPATTIAATTTATSTTWTAVAPSSTLTAKPSAASTTWTAVTPATSGSAITSPSPVSAAWSVVTPSTAASLAVSPASATWSAESPATQLQTTVEVTAISVTWSALAPSVQRALAVSPVAATWAVVVPSASSDTEIPGIEFRAADRRLHFRAADRRLHFKGQET